jgi:hypothetical protein
MAVVMPAGAGNKGEGSPVALMAWGRAGGRFVPGRPETALRGVDFLPAGLRVGFSGTKTLPARPAGMRWAALGRGSGRVRDGGWRARRQKAARGEIQVPIAFNL